MAKKSVYFCLTKASKIYLSIKHLFHVIPTNEYSMKRIHFWEIKSALVPHKLFESRESLLYFTPS